MHDVASGPGPMRRTAEGVGVTIGLVLTGVYAHSLAMRVLGTPGGQAAVVVAVVAVILCLHRIPRGVVRVVSFGHAIIGFSMAHILVTRYGADQFEHLLWNAAIPACAGLFICSDWVDRGPEPPPGYEHLRRIQRSVGIEWKLPLGAFVAIQPWMPLGLFAVAVILLVPVGFVIWLVHAMVGLIRHRRGDVPTASRRLRTSHGRGRTNQRCGFGTFNDADYRDRDPD